jgi:hypothetical protein
MNQIKVIITLISLTTLLSLGSTFACGKVTSTSLSQGELDEIRHRVTEYRHKMSRKKTNDKAVKFYNINVHNGSKRQLYYKQITHVLDNIDKSIERYRKHHKPKMTAALKKAIDKKLQEFQKKYKPVQVMFAASKFYRQHSKNRAEFVMKMAYVHNALTHH